jgi:hypothetical protein
MKMARLILVLVTLCLLGQQAQAANKALVYFVTGGPFEKFNPRSVREAGQSYLAVLKDYVRINYGEDMVGKELHQTKSKQICEEIIMEKTQVSPEAKVILVGHSYGSSGSFDIARCLEKEKIQVDLLISVDTVARSFKTNFTTVPENVVINYNYYQHTDSFPLQGIGNNKRKDKSLRGIRNFNLKYAGDAIGDHMNIITEIFTTRVAFNLSYAVIDGLPLEQVDQLVQTAHKLLFQKRPLVK